MQLVERTVTTAVRGSEKRKKLAPRHRRSRCRRMCLQTGRAARRNARDRSSHRQEFTLRARRRVAWSRWCDVAPAHQHQPLVAVQQPVDRRVVERPGARCVERHASGGAVQAVEHAAMRHPHDRACRRVRWPAVRPPRCNVRRNAVRLSPRAGANVASRARQRAVSSGQCRPMSAYVKPSNTPKQRSRSPRSRCTRRPPLGGQRRCRLHRARQVAGHDGIDRLVGQRLRQLLRLPTAECIERRVELALHARFRVPGRLPVADRDDAGGFVQRMRARLNRAPAGG